MKDIYQLLIAAGNIPLLEKRDFANKRVAIDLRSIEGSIFDRRARIEYVKTKSSNNLVVQLQKYVDKLKSGLQVSSVVVATGALFQNPRFWLSDVLANCKHDNCIELALKHDNVRFYEDAFEIDQNLASVFASTFECVAELDSDQFDYVITQDCQLLCGKHSLVMNVQELDFLISNNVDNIRCFTCQYLKTAITEQIRWYAQLSSSRTFPGVFYATSTKNLVQMPLAIEFEEMQDYLVGNFEESALRILEMQHFVVVINNCGSFIVLDQGQSILELLYAQIAQSSKIAQADYDFMKKYFPFLLTKFSIDNTAASVVATHSKLLARLRSIDAAATKTAKLKFYRQTAQAAISFDDFCYFSDINAATTSVGEHFVNVMTG